MSLDDLHKKHKKKNESVFVESDEEVIEEVYSSGTMKKNKRVKEHSTPKTPKTDGYNYTGIGILLLFIVPALLTMGGSVLDYLYPEQAQERMIRNRLVNCYTEVAPEKLGSIDSFMKKYKGREMKLLQNLELKYPKVSECAFRR